MIEIAGTITYTDGRCEPYTAHQREFAAWERFALSHGYPLPTLETPAALPNTMARYLGFAAVHAGRAPRDWPAFEAWADDVLEVAADETTDAENGVAVIGAAVPSIPPAVSVD